MSNAVLAGQGRTDTLVHHLPPTPIISGALPAWPDGEDSATLAVRFLADNPNHHLWNNNGTWWCHYTMHMPDSTKWRVRTSLATHDLAEARRLRDALLAAQQNKRV